MTRFCITRRVALTGLTILGIAATQLGLAAVPAGARVGYLSPTFFGAPGPGDGQFTDPAGVAVEDSSGDVYVADEGGNRVEKFDAEGTYLAQFDGSGNPAFPGGFKAPTGIAVNNSAGASSGDVYVVDTGDDVIDKISPAGTFLSELNGFASAIKGVATDAAGHVWVFQENKAVEELDGSTENRLMATWESPFGAGPAIAVDSEENVYLLRGEPNVAEFTKEGGSLDEQITRCGCNTAIAIDRSNNNLFTDSGSSIGNYPSSGEPYPGSDPVETLGGISSSDGLGVNDATHTLYATQGEADTVAVFKAALAPDVTTGGTREIGKTSATAEGSVNPDGQAVTVCGFEYGTTEAYGQTAECEPQPGAGSSPVSVGAKLTGLAAGTTYDYRLVANNADGVRSAGLNEKFTTPAAVEGLQTGQAGEVQGTSATLNGSLEPNGLDTHYFFEYGPLGSFGVSTPLTDAGSASKDEALSAPVGGLTPHQLYNFRLVAENQTGGTSGETSYFLTPIVAPQVSGTPSASLVKSQSAVLSASVNPEHTATRYHFEYGPCPTLVGCAKIESTTDEASALYRSIYVSQEASGLLAQTTYSYRLVASNEFEEEGNTFGGAATGAEGTFTTAPAPTPSVQSGEAAALTPTSATISGTVNPDGVPVSYSFQLGIYEAAQTQYGTIASGSAGAGAEPLPVSLALANLQPGTTYAYRLSIASGYIASDPDHVLYSAPATFTTPGLPAAIAPPPVLPELAIPAIAFPGQPQVPPPHPAKKKLSRARLLARALNACRRQPKHRRSACRRAAHRRYSSQSPPSR